MLSLERVDANSIDFDKINRYSDRTIFQTPDWLNFISSTQNGESVLALVKDGQNTVGFFAGSVVQKYGFRILGSPFPGWTTFYMGFCLFPGTSRRAAVEALLRFAFNELGCIHVELMDRNLTLDDIHHLGFEHRNFATVEIDLTQSDDDLLANMSKSCRWGVRKSEKNGVTIEEAYDPSFAYEYYDQLVEVFAKQSLVPTYGVERVCELIKYILPTDQLLLLRARDAKGHCIATGIFPAMNQTMYFWGGASWRKYQHLLPNEAIQWYAIRYWKERKIRSYDMGGIRDYKRKYGGREIFVPWARKSKYAFIPPARNLAQVLFKTRQHLLGSWHRISGQTALASEK